MSSGPRTTPPRPRVAGDAAPYVRRMQLVRFLFAHALIGALIGLVVVAGLFWKDVAGLRELFTMNGEMGVVAAVLLSVGFVVTFSSLSMGYAVMQLRPEDDA